MTHSILSWLLAISLFATVGALFFGLGAMFKGEEFNKKHGNTAMQWRILLQACALIMFFLILWFGK